MSVDYDRYLHFSLGVSEHFLQFFRIFIYVDVDGPIPVGCPSLVAEGSGVRAVNDDFIRHDAVPPFGNVQRRPWLFGLQNIFKGFNHTFNTGNAYLVQ